MDEHSLYPQWKWNAEDFAWQDSDGKLWRSDSSNNWYEVYKCDVTNAQNNPKHAHGEKKAPTHYIPPIAEFYLGRVMEHGAKKYGAFNWGESGVVASIYYDAIRRHLAAYYAGEYFDPESGHPHLACIMACCAILLDCHELNNVEDDRPIGKTTPYKEV